MCCLIINVVFANMNCYLPLRLSVNLVGLLNPQNISCTLVYSLCFFISVFPICNHYSLLKLVVLLCVSTSTERALRSGSKIFSAAILECLLLYYVCQFDFLAKFRKEGFSADLADHRSFNLSSCDIGLWF